MVSYLSWPVRVSSWVVREPGIRSVALKIRVAPNSVEFTIKKNSQNLPGWRARTLRRTAAVSWQRGLMQTTAKVDHLRWLFGGCQSSNSESDGVRCTDGTLSRPMSHKRLYVSLVILAKGALNFLSSLCRGKSK